MGAQLEIGEFIPRSGLAGGHRQTLAGNFLRRKSLLPPAEARLFQVEPDVKILCHCHWQPEDRRRDAMTVVVVHGLEGSSESQYAHGVGSKAWAEGWNVVRMNMRNCGGTEHLAPTLYHSGLSQDVGAVVRELTEKDGLKRIGLVGYSMGGNLVLKLAGEWAQTPPREIAGVCGVSPAMDLAPSADALHDPANRIYEWKFLFGLRGRYRRKAELFPERYDLGKLAWENFTSIRVFDDRITAFYSGFTGADDYYYRASSARVAEHIRVPALVLHAEDDPFIRMTAPTKEMLSSNPHVRLIESAHGGHCAFLASANGYDGRWAERTCVTFLGRL
ncbi:MAG: alpha/beta fold hydrolase [Acidobacteriales bacterium]|nr:alpha/beta fold hydrolase [Terriglobales bacterium]